MKKSEAASEYKMRETKSKSVSVKSQKQKPAAKEVKPVEKEVRSLKEEVKSLKKEVKSLKEEVKSLKSEVKSLKISVKSDDFDSDIYDSEEDGLQRETEDGEGDSSEDEVHGHEGSDDNDDDGDECEQVDGESGVEDGSDEGSEQDEVPEERDSSEDEVTPRNTVGDDVPLEWYKDEKHIGYDITGKNITKKEKQDKLDSFLATMDDTKKWRKIHDEYNDEEVELTKEEWKLVRRMLKGEAPHADFDPYADYVDWFKWDDAIHPLSSAPEPKRRFIPSKWEAKKVVKYLRAIRKGLIKFDRPEEEPNVYLLWGDDSTSDQKSKQLTYIPPPKLKLPGHEESYNPSLEYIPTEEEIASYYLMYEEDRPKFISKRFTSLRSIPAYENALKESFDRCLDLYLCPRVRKKRVRTNLIISFSGAIFLLTVWLSASAFFARRFGKSIDI